eukprot:4235492-Pyramimonas_sp.AAC.1
MNFGVVTGVGIVSAGTVPTVVDLGMGTVTTETLGIPGSIGTTTVTRVMFVTFESTEGIATIGITVMLPMIAALIVVIVAGDPTVETATVARVMVAAAPAPPQAR